jgi:hypothetical protein
MRSHSKKAAPPRRRFAKAAIGAAALAAAALLALGATAGAELAQNGNIQVVVSGGIFPTRLPRSTPAPVAVQMGAKISTTDKSTPPELKTIALQINRHGILDTAGLPTCPLAKLDSISSKDARRACGKALVGHGNVTSRVSLPGQGAFATNGPLLAFNGHYKGHQAVFAQVASGEPLPLTYVIVFEVKKASGLYGSAFVAQMPPIASHYGYISAINLSLKRTFTVGAQKHSFMSADCPALKGVPGAVFPFAKASFGFADGRTVTSTLVRQCKAGG